MVVRCTKLKVKFHQRVIAVAIAVIGAVSPANAQVTSFMQSVAESAASDPDIAAFYKSRTFEPLWTGSSPQHVARRAALMKAIMTAEDHALPVAEYDLASLQARLSSISTERDLGALEVELTQVFLDYARDLTTGVLTPGQIDSEIVRKVPLRDRTELLAAFSSAQPTQFMLDLAPSAPEYARLVKAKMRLKAQQASGGWGPTVQTKSLKPGDGGADVVALRNRLIAMGFMARSASQVYDDSLQAAVQRFQERNGLEADGVAGAGTVAEINKPISERIASVYVAIERERWTNMERGDRHIWVNLTDFSATIVDHDEVTFRTRSVIGKNDEDRRSPEFSDVMEYMEINPYWNVPRSISVNEYLPKMISSGGGAFRHLDVVDNRGRVVSRGAVGWSRYTPKSFPFNLRQAPSKGNALGLVKFMFPNRYNIYLHDTPAKSLFAREVRAFSHGCIRLNDPFDFGYALLAKQYENPKQVFDSYLRSGANTRVNLETPVPVHLVYRTAFTTAKGELHFRRDVYGRDAKIFRALQRAGVVSDAFRS